MKKMRAKIHWLSATEGGRRTPPAVSPPGVHPYSPVVRFKDEVGPNPTVSWSLGVEQIPSLSTDTDWVASVFFRMPDAPHDALRVGRAFVLLEGARVVGDGVLIGEAGDD